jgi:hypothetical protein
MDEWINDMVERINEALERRPGMLPLLGVGFIVVNFLLQIFPGSGVWLVDSNLLLHLGLIVSIVGLLLIAVYRH